MKRKALLACVVAFVCAAVLAPSAGAAPPRSAIAPINLAGQACTIPNVGTGTVTSGTLTITGFTSSAGTLLANGTATATCVVQTALGPVSQTSTRAVSIPVNLAQSSGSCQILDLVLGPLNLDLLGLVVHLDTVHLNITAQRGQGNLLGNLLCGIAGLLDSGGATNVLANLLNQLLGVLGGV